MATNSRIKAVERATNRTWDEWLRYMDGIVAKELDGKIESGGWWVQSVTVAYEENGLSS